MTSATQPNTSADLTASSPQDNYSKKQQQLARDIFELQRGAFDSAPFADEKLRRQQLKALKSAIFKHKDKLVKAVSADFGCRSEDETLLADILPTIMSLDHALKHLRQWMKPQKRAVSMLFQPAKAAVAYQPLGVVGIMSPWNYPVYLSLGPLIAAIAAGNRVMLKPSEFCPYANRILKDIVEDAFSKDEVFMVEGDAQVAATFTSLPFDHILFTGSTNVGRKVMAAAANNLTPVTLELGGKSPAFMAPDVSPEFAAERMLFGKCLNAGQTCVAPDYVLCPQEKLQGLIQALTEGYKTLYPDPGNGDFSSIINAAQHQRLTSWLEDARAKGAEITVLGQAPLQTDDSNKTAMPLYLVTKVTPEMTLMQEEIFGPILPIVTYQDTQEAISLIQQQPRPLALYLFTFDKKLENRVLRETHAGGVCINETVTHVAQDDLPFGGVGPSGMGHYHAKEGFETFSHAKAIFKRGRFNSAKMAFPPYGKLIHRFIYRWYLGK